MFLASLLPFNYLLKHPIKTDSTVLYLTHIKYILNLFYFKKYPFISIISIVSLFEVNTTFLRVLYDTTNLPFILVVWNKRKCYNNSFLIRYALYIISIVLKLLPTANFFIVLTVSLRDLSPIQSHLVTTTVQFPIFVFSKFILLKRAVDVSFSIRQSIFLLALKNVFIFPFDRESIDIILIKKLFLIINTGKG